MIDFGGEVCGLLPASERREWLVTNGIGGYAAGTVAGLLTRRYHGLLIAALKPPVGRTLLLANIRDIARDDRNQYPLYTARHRAQKTLVRGCVNIERFHMEGAIPVWTFACADALIEKRIWMEQGFNTTYISYTLARASVPLSLRLSPLVNYRDAHRSTKSGTLPIQADGVDGGLRIGVEGNDPYYVLTDRASFTSTSEWLLPNYLSIEAERRFKDVYDANLRAGRFEITLQPGEGFCMIATTEANADLDRRAAYQRRTAYERNLVAQAGFDDAAADRLVLGADQFIVRRSTPANPDGHTVIAGYPWFADWGRDTMIALPGLTLATRRYDIAASILRTFAQFEDQGMLPNRFPEAGRFGEAGEAPEYNTVDATLWYLEAIRAYYAATGDASLLHDLMPTLQSIIEWHVRGTRYNIHVQDDGLLYAGASDVQLTWMDVKIGDWVVTPRTGKAVEINALWYNALCCMMEFARVVGVDAAPFALKAEQAKVGFGKFWNANANCLYDVIDGPEGNDASLRPNQLFAVSLPHSALSADQQRAVVDTCARTLLTSHGLRSLSRDHENYAPRYEGDPKERDAVYHQGTVWGWLIGAFASAHLRVYRDKEAARRFVLPLIRHSQEHSLGTISEIFDGDPPYSPHGCFAQAWSVGEVLRVLRQTI